MMMPISAPEAAMRLLRIESTSAPAGNWLIKGITLGAVGRITDQVQISGGYMHLDAHVFGTTDGTAGSIPANVPANTFNLWATYNPVKAWEIGGGAFYVSQRYVADSELSAAGAYDLGGRVRHHAQHPGRFAAGRRPDISDL